MSITVTQGCNQSIDQQSYFFFGTKQHSLTLKFKISNFFTMPSLNKRENLLYQIYVLLLNNLHMLKPHDGVCNLLCHCYFLLLLCLLDPHYVLFSLVVIKFSKFESYCSFLFTNSKQFNAINVVHHFSIINLFRRDYLWFLKNF